MKELFNTLSNVSDFFTEKRYVYRNGLPQRPSQVPKKEVALDPIGTKGIPAVDKLMKLTKKQFEAAQKRGREMERRAEEKFGRIDKSPEAIARSKEYRKNKKATLTKLVKEVALMGPESNYASVKRDKNGKLVVTAIKGSVARGLGNAFQNLGRKAELKLATYYDLIRDEIGLKVGEREEHRSPTKSLQRKLEKEVWNMLVSKATVKTSAGKELLAYLMVEGKPRKRVLTFKEALARAGKKTPAKRLTRVQRLALAKRLKRERAAEKKEREVAKKRFAVAMAKTPDQLVAEALQKDKMAAKGRPADELDRAIDKALAKKRAPARGRKYATRPRPKPGQ